MNKTSYLLCELNVPIILQPIIFRIDPYAMITLIPSLLNPICCSNININPLEAIHSDINKNITVVKSTPLKNGVIGSEYLFVPYLYKINEQGEKIALKIHNICFEQNIGLVFDKKSNKLSGMPTLAGTIIAIYQYVEPYSTKLHNYESAIIINPNPRNLWKDIPPPVDGKYFKTNIDHKLIQQNDINIIAASRRGRSHAHVGSFRDDDFFVDVLPNNWQILLVADGAGSATYSREGSKLVVNAFHKELSDNLTNNSWLIDAINQWHIEDQKKIGGYFSQLFLHSAQKAVNSISKECANENEIFKHYSTTILACVSLRVEHQLFSAAFWLGDGCIAVYDEQHQVIRLLGEPDSGEFAGQTQFLDHNVVDSADFVKRIRIGKWESISHIILMTDGISDPIFETDNGLKNNQNWQNFIQDIKPFLTTGQDSEMALTDWLNFFVKGNHDDRTIAISWIDK